MCDEEVMKIDLEDGIIGSSGTCMVFVQSLVEELGSNESLCS